MSTIAELMDGKRPGEIKVAHPHWEYYYTPFYVDKDGYWYGLDRAGRHFKIREDKQWYLYQEPEPKKIVYEWMVASEVGWVISSGLYTEEEAGRVFRNPIKKTGRQFEVEVDIVD